MLIDRFRDETGIRSDMWSCLGSTTTVRDYLHSYIVFDGNQENLDPTWTLSLSNSLWAQAEKLGYPGIPIQLFVRMSEWPDLKRKLPLSDSPL